MPIKISKASKDLNVGVERIRSFLAKNGIEIDNNPNARIDDTVYDMLVKQFSPDKELRAKADDHTKERQKGREKERKVVEDIPTDIPGQKHKIIGKIDLNPSKPVKAEEPSKKPVKADAPKHAEQPKPEPVKEKEVPTKAEETQPKQDTPAPRQEPKADDNNKPEQATKQPEPKKEEPKKEEPKPATAEPEKDDNLISLRPETPAARITVVGKIDLDSLNTNTRPKPKTKEEKKKERIAKEKEKQAAAESQRKKRKRIGKEKIDIERSGNMIQNQGKKGGNNQGGNNNDQGGKKKDKKAKRPFKPELNEEDIQRQMKETLAKLNDKKNNSINKGADWRKKKRDRIQEVQQETAKQEAAQRKTIKLTEFVTANDLAAMMDIPVNKIIGTCFSLGIMVSINQRLDAETINIVADEFGFKTEYASTEVVEAIQDEEDAPEDLVQRPPVVTVMGHVDHGKTSLLDHIRNTNVIAGEAGGITQHIGAYIVKLKNGRRITFLDTPGHAAFTAMRARGAKVTDIAIIIVAADDSVMPQTDEALSHASAAGVPIIFAINKIDKPGANPEKIKEELANRNYLVEDWGGKYQSQDISAKKGTGVFELLEKVLLEADLLDLKANPNRKATGSIIESSLDKGRGYVATVLVDNGTLRVGDIVLAGTHYGKVKAMFNERGQRITEAGPACPAVILGLNGAPTAGDKFNVMDTDQEARQIANKREQLQREQKARTQKRIGLQDIGRRMALGEFHELNIIVKGDVDGSIEALSDSLIKLSTPEVQVNVIHKAVGAISESDVTLAEASDAIIVGFQVRPSADAKRLATQQGVDIRTYSIIYDAIEEIKSAMEGMLSAEVKEEVCGTAEVLQVYHISKVGTIAGAIVREGKIKKSCKVRVIRDGIVRFTGNLASLKRFKDDAKEVATGFDCGLSLQSYNDLVVGDMIEAFEEVEVQRTL
ncbi:MAG: translation initiation factor IF-2 [Muribaculaceae bacterium]|nr:translation initiation factor IF-2 [Muribaculaceae bacterium]